ncbi:MAG: rRNA pseudouridine synthase [Deltaproteobacteria bacterium]|jgi:23S rRNA pseudouridine2605 synthase|nr:rRNA pseudouridine synthase [Deltaproteobacteria bacterium]
MRLNKALAHAGLCARRKADELIFAGAVRVNGEVAAEPGRQVDPARDRIEVNGIPLAANAPPCHLMLHKPVRVVSTARDPEGRTTVLDLVPPAWRGRRLYPVGRLDFFSEGLLMLTDDGELANLLAHPRHRLPRRYEVRVRGETPEQALNAMRRGMTLSEGERLARVEVTAAAQGRDTMLHMTLRQGLNRQIRRMCRDLDLTILRLVRVALGPLELGDLAPGAVRELTEQETAALRKAAGR